MLENEKIEWLGRQIRILKATPGEEGRKQCEENAKQMEPFFKSVDELEIIKFFIHEGGGGNGDGKSKSEGTGSIASAPSDKESTPGDAPLAEPEKPVEKSNSGETKSGSVYPDGTYTIVKSTKSESYIDMIALDSPHRMRKGIMLTDNKEFISYLFSAYGPTFQINKYGNAISITL